MSIRNRIRLIWARFDAWPLPARALFVVIATANFVLIAITIPGFFVGGAGYDWLIYVEAGRRALSGGVFDWSGAYAWSYSPVLAYAFTALAPIGIAGWSLLHVAALVLLPSRRLALLTLLSWPFWVDLYNGNTVTFVLVAAGAAMADISAGTFAYLLLCVLMPRPLMLPVMVWILWQRPVWRLRFGLIAMLSIGGAFVSGYLQSWIAVLLGVGSAVAISDRDIGPSALLGPTWVLIGAILAVFFTARHRLGWASMAASPYWLPQYLLMLLLEAVPLGLRKASRGPASGAGIARTPSIEHQKRTRATSELRDQP